MTKYCKFCGAKKGEHKIYSVTGNLYMNCERTNCEMEYAPDYFDKDFAKGLNDGEKVE